jgi:twitching motility protein PilT
MQNELMIHRLLAKMSQLEASDLHIKIGSPPILRVAATLHRVDLPILTTEETESLLKPLIPSRLLTQLDADGGVDFSYTYNHGRYRCSVFHAGGGLHSAIRRVNSKIPDFEMLHLPPVYEHVADQVQDGLVIICGVTGSGKSSTLASIINHLNHRRAYNMITIEDPVEYLFTPEKSVISQREVGLDVVDFPTALRGAVRQDPDLIVIGEMRDKETLLARLMAAETGHLVFATLHTVDTVQAFSRILEFFSTDQHPFIRACLANGLPLNKLVDFGSAARVTGIMLRVRRTIVERSIRVMSVLLQFMAQWNHLIYIHEVRSFRIGGYPRHNAKLLHGAS